MIVFDMILFRLINNFAGRWPALDIIGVFCASILIWIMGLALLVIFWRRSYLREQRHEFATVLGALFSSLFAWIANILVSLVWFRPRPFVNLNEVHLLIAKDAAEKSFPSDHAAVAFAVAVAVYLAHRRAGRWFLAAAMLVALGRVFVGVHYPADVVIGALIGAASAWFVHRFGRRFFERLLKKQEKSV